MELRARIVTFLILLTLLSTSGALIFFKSSEIPKNLSYDEVASTHLALSLRAQPLTLYSPLATGHTTPYFYILMIFFNIFGVHNWVLRLPSALFGIAATLMMYFVMNSIYRNRFMALMLTLVFVSMRWYLTFTRFSFEATFLLFLEISALFFLLKSQKSNKPWATITGALFSSMAFYSYTPGRLFPVIASLFGYVYTKTNRFILQLAIMVLLVTPLVIVLGTRIDTRIEQVSVLKNQSLSPMQKATAIKGNIIKAASMFFLYGDMNGRHNYPGKPALNPILAIMLVIGMAIAIIRIKETYNIFFLSYFLLALIPMILTNPADNPNMLRSISVLPAVIYFIGLVIHQMLLTVKGQKLQLVASVSICVLLILSAAYELRTYFMFQSRVMRNSFEVTCNLDILKNTGYTYVPKNCIVKKNEF